MGKGNNYARCTECSCELCREINACPIDIGRHGTKLTTVRIKINNVCLGKKVAVAVVLYDQLNRIVAFKGFITMACRHNECDKDSCGTIERKLVFVLPEDEECDLNVRTIANYIYPCEDDR
jgi:hypothetical protein